jgi:hypothetical protein
MESCRRYMPYYSIIIGSALDALTVDYYLGVTRDTF